MPHVDLILPGPGGPEAAPHRTQNAQRAQRPRQNVDRDESRAAIALRPFLVAADALAYSHVLAREHLMPHDIAELDFQCLRAIFPTIPAAVLLRLHRASKEVRAPAVTSPSRGSLHAAFRNMRSEYVCFQGRHHRSAGQDPRL